MLRPVLASAAMLAMVTACRISLEDDTVAPTDASTLSPSCEEAQTRQDIGFLEEKVFGQSCVFSGCHNGGGDAAGQMDIRAGMAKAHLVNVDSLVNANYKLVVPGQPKQSYLLYMLRHYTEAEMEPPVDMLPPIDVGFMPQNAGGAQICVQKREAIERWIMDGAP